MKIQIIVLAAALCCAGTVQAQSTTAEHECIQADESTWKSLGLDAAQITRVKAVQENCRKACAESMKSKGTHDEAAMNRHEAELQAILTKDQYTGWQKWCSTTHTPDGEHPKEMAPDKK